MKQYAEAIRRGRERREKRSQARTAAILGGLSPWMRANAEMLAERQRQAERERD